MIARPILFSGEMVRALLDGRKTQTRRIVKGLPDWGTPMPCSSITDEGWQGPLDYSLWAHEGERDDGDARRCPYGKPGDLLWVRERAAFYWNAWRYFADGPKAWGKDVSEATFRSPSIHMPRAASRLTLKIADVRVERLQDITNADATAEGARFFADLPMGLPSTQPARWSMEDAPPDTDHCLMSPKWAFANYWNKLNGDGSWDANPFVWVVCFEPIRRNIDELLRSAAA